MTTTSDLFFRAAIERLYSGRYRLWHEVRIRQVPDVAPIAWPEVWHLDMVGMERQRPKTEVPFRTLGIEIKSSRADFLSDKKWQNYIGRVDGLVFVTAPDVIAPAELSGTGVGLWYVTAEITACWPPHKTRLWPKVRIVRRHKWTTERMSVLQRFDLMYGLAINARTDRDWDKMFQRHAEAPPAPATANEPAPRPAQGRKGR